MSKLNVNRFSELIETFNRLAEAPESFDLEGIDRYLRFYDPDVRFEPQQSALQGRYMGHDGVRQWLADAAEHYGAGQLHIDDIRSLGDRVVGLGTLRVTGRAAESKSKYPWRSWRPFKTGLSPISRTTASTVKPSRP